MFQLPEVLIPVFKRIIDEEGSPYLVGGFVRDYLMGRSPMDYDFEVLGIESRDLARILSSFGALELVGQSFGVYNLFIGDGIYQFSIPRTEVKTGSGHKGFQAILDPFLDIKSAQSRRDFTVNSMYIDLRSYLEEGQVNIIDHFGGRNDLENRILRHTSSKFSEDPLRILRGFRFAALGFKMHTETIDLCRNIVYDLAEVSKERVKDEFLGWAKNPYPSMGLSVLEQTNAVLCFPVLLAMIGTLQDKTWHPEGDVWTHTALVCDEAVKIANRMQLSDEDRQILVLSSSLHDCGKPITSTTKEGRIVSPGHDKEGAELAYKFLNTFRFSNNQINRITELVALHMWHVHNYVNSKSVRRLLAKLKYNKIDMLLALIEADHSGRPPLPKGLPDKLKDVKRIIEEEEGKIKPIILGRHIEALGYKPGKWFGTIIKIMYDRQLNGEFNNLSDGLESLKKLLALRDKYTG